MLGKLWGQLWQQICGSQTTAAQPVQHCRYNGWRIIHRTLGEYHRHFPEYAVRIHDALQQEFPGAIVVHEHFDQCAEEPVVVPPGDVAETLRSEARERAASVYNQAVSSILQSGAGGQSTEAAKSGGLGPPNPDGPPAVSENASDVQGTWIVIVPMFQLVISDDAPINGRWEVGEVSFLSRNQLAAMLRPPKLTTIPRPAVWDRIANEDSSFAVVTSTGTPRQLRQTIYSRLRQAADVLASTAAFYGRRHHSCGFALKGYPFHTAKHDHFIQTDGTAFCGNWNQRGLLQPFTLDDQWYNAITRSGIRDLFIRITDNTLCPKWRRQILSGAAMLGRSLMSLDLADAFLLNVIGLETLLTRKGERNGFRLFKRIKGMTGWHLGHARPDYEAEIRRIHGVRCEIVHDSDYSHLTIELLLQADMYLANSLLNIVQLPSVFPDKDTLATILDSYADNGNWPIGNSNSFRWFGNTQFDQADLDLPLW